ncbi:hemoglobin [Chitinophaga sp. CF118]|uniref:group III truncated hemoglobin n=1 Tax=Chitinophaga sp. CF118 TaxID=1884367 RepID=UPI0008F3DC09|nr:group III truncated hemoglobin [Chitinophaga sp. CF118]SFE55462.1 hemoglobin [Chitinophaga sp. CF118]
MPELKDIQGIEDIKWMVDRFYGKVREDGLLGPIFLSHIGNDWTAHLNIMYNFWNMAIFGNRDYTGNPFQKHKHMPLDSIYFDRWLLHFHATLDERFDGPVTNDTKKKAQTIAATFLHRITSLRQS